MRRAIRALSPVVVVAAVLTLTPALGEAGEVKQTPSLASQTWQWLSNLWQEATSWFPGPGTDGDEGNKNEFGVLVDEGAMIDPNGGER